jgi:hypothetical protein
MARMETPRPHFDEFKQRLISTKGATITAEAPKTGLIAYTLPDNPTLASHSLYRGEYGEVILGENGLPRYSLNHHSWVTDIEVPSKIYPHISIRFLEFPGIPATSPIPAIEWAMPQRAPNGESKKPVDYVAYTSYIGGKLYSFSLGPAWDYQSNVKALPFNVVALEGKYEMKELLDRADIPLNRIYDFVHTFHAMGGRVVLTDTQISAFRQRMVSVPERVNIKALFADAYANRTNPADIYDDPSYKPKWLNAGNLLDAQFSTYPPKLA